MRHSVFPFSAIAGQHTVRRALILNAVNPRIGGVLISGQKGTAKSTMVRGLAEVLGGMEVIDLPLNITEDRLVGSIDIEAAIARGETVAEPGLLYRADGNILYIDEVNLLSEHIANCLLETAASGTNIIEREGISWKHNARFILIGTMNPEEGLLRPQLIDRFGLYVEAQGETESEQRMEIIRRRLEFERNPARFLQTWKNKTRQLAGRIETARNMLSKVSVTEENLSLTAAIAHEAGCAGHRAEIVTIEAAMAVAALDSRTAINEADIREAASFSIPHRMRERLTATPPEPEQQEEEQQPEESNNDHPQDNNETNQGNEQSTPPIDLSDFSPEQPQKDTSEQGQSLEDDIQAPDGDFDICIDTPQFRKTIKARGSGKRSRVKSGTLQGRYVRYRVPGGTTRDLALDATLRAAAPFQKSREHNGLSMNIRSEDIREKIREKRTGCIILFVVDASASMGAKKRMAAVKGAVVSMLDDAYRKRDRVGVIAFRRDSAESLLGITRSVDLAFKCLKDLPTGGKTPLADGLAKAWETLKTASLREPDILPCLVLVSDGRTNVGLSGNNPVDDSLKMAVRLKNEGIHSIVLDTEQGYIRLGLAKRIAEALDAEYIKMDNISAHGIKSSIEHMIR